MRKKYRQVKNSKGEYEYVETETRRWDGHLVMEDIQPYKSIITGETITSRSKHREHLKVHGCEEVGDNVPKFLRDKYERNGERPIWGRDGRRVDI